MPAAVKPAINAAHSIRGLGFMATARALVRMAVTTSAGVVISSGIEIAEMANTANASTAPIAVPVTSSPRPRGVNSKVGMKSLGGGRPPGPRNSMNSRSASWNQTRNANPSTAQKK